jgi:hypothetical protein
MIDNFGLGNWLGIIYVIFFLLLFFLDNRYFGVSGGVDPGVMLLLLLQVFSLFMVMVLSEAIDR